MIDGESLILRLKLSTGMQWCNKFSLSLRKTQWPYQLELRKKFPRHIRVQFSGVISCRIMVLTTASLADALGVSRQTINEILQKIEALGQTISRLRELFKNSGINPSQVFDVLQELINKQNAEFQKRFNHQYYDPSFAQNDR